LLLDGKIAIIYGAGGAIGGAVARRFAREGAQVVLAGRTRETLDRVKADIDAAGGRCQVAPVDALDPTAVPEHAAATFEGRGRIDIALNCVGLAGLQGTPLVEMTPDAFAAPVMTAMYSHFLTGTAVGDYMARSGSGVILAVTAQAARTPYPNVGGFGVAGAAIEGLCRQFAAELGPRGVRVVCLRSAGSPDTPGVRTVWGKHAANAGVSLEAFEAETADKTLLRRLPTLADVADVAALMASDYARAVTGEVGLVTCGELVD
jgi:NAD(P)-dependent dehydrogenase (short-subunit alcohol dehydrogenase family)